MFGVKGVFFQCFIHIPGQFQAVFAAACPRQFRSSIDDEGNAIGIFGLIDGVAMGIHYPVGSSVFLVHKMFLDVVLRMVGHFQVAGILQEAVGACKGPHEPGVEHDGTVRLPDRFQCPQNGSVKTAFGVIIIIDIKIQDVL